MANPKDGKLQKGDKCNNTVAVQNAINIAREYEKPLKKLAPLVCDGVFGTKTDEAVRKFQEIVKLPDVDGIVGNGTGAELFQPGTLMTTITVQGLKSLPKATGFGMPVPPNMKLLPSTPGGLANAGAAFLRDGLVNRFMSAPRTNGVGISVPKLQLNPQGLAREAFSANGFGTQIIEKLPFGNIASQFFKNQKAISIAFTSQVSTLDGFSVSFSKPIVQPIRGPSLNSSSGIVQGPGGTRFQWSTYFLPVGKKTWQFKPWLKLDVEPKITTSLTAPLALGKGTIDMDLQATLDAKLTVRPFDIQVATPIVNVQGVEFFLSGGVGALVHGRFTPSNGAAELNAKFGASAVGGITTFWDITPPNIRP